MDKVVLTPLAGFKPVSLLATTKYTRAWPGGSGGYKLGAKWVIPPPPPSFGRSDRVADDGRSYAPGVVPAGEAAKYGYGQILWLSGEDHTLTEVSLPSTPPLPRICSELMFRSGRDDEPVRRAQDARRRSRARDCSSW